MYPRKQTSALFLNQSSQIYTVGGSAPRRLNNIFQKNRSYGSLAHRKHKQRTVYCANFTKFYTYFRYWISKQLITKNSSHRFRHHCHQCRFKKWHNSQTGLRVSKVCVAARLPASCFQAGS